MKKQQNFLIVSYVISEVSKNCLCRYLFEFSYIPEILEKFYLNLVVFILAQIIYLLDKNKSFSTLEMIIGILLSLLSFKHFESIYSYGFQFSFILSLVIELLSLGLISFVSELVSGRRLKTEKNTVVVISLALIGAILSFPNSFKVDSILFLSIIQIIRMFFYNIIKHIFLSCSEIGKATLLTSSLNLARNSMNYASSYGFEVAKVHQDILEHLNLSSVLLVIMIINYFLDIYVFKHIDIDLIFLLKSVSMLITLTLNDVIKSQN